MNIGDSIGMIQLVYKNERKFWVLLEDKIEKIEITKKYGRRYYTKIFKSLDDMEIDSNTKIMEDAVGKGYIFRGEMFVLNEKTRPFAEQWILWANENTDKVKSAFDD